jgi:hypothetical protein
MQNTEAPFVYLCSHESLTYQTLYERINNEQDQVNQHKYYHCTTKLSIETKQLSLQLFIDPESLSQKLSDAQYRAYGINRKKYITVDIDIHGVNVYLDKVPDDSEVSVNVYQSGNVSTRDYSDSNKSFALLRNIIEKLVTFKLKNFYLSSILSGINGSNILKLIQFIEYTILKSCNKCIITGRIVNSRFRPYMPNNKKLFTVAEVSGFADELLNYYVENEPSTLEYIINCAVGPGSNHDVYKYYYYTQNPDFEMFNGMNAVEEYDTIRHELTKLPSISNMTKYSEQGKLKEVEESSPYVCSSITIRILIFYLYRVINYYNGLC